MRPLGTTAAAATWSLFALGACATTPSPEVVGAPALAPVGGAALVAEVWSFEREIENVGDGETSRFFPTLRLLHQDAADGHAGRDDRVLPTGALGDSLGPMPVAGVPCTIRHISTVVGPWPRAAWSVSRCKHDFGQGATWFEQLLEWKDGSWNLVSDAWQKNSDTIHLVPWGDEGALVVAELAFPDPWEPGSKVECLPGRGQVTLGAARAAAPTILDGQCEFAPLAVATTPAGDVFVVGRPLPETVGDIDLYMRLGPLEVRRWRPGVATPERDEIVSAVGDTVTFGARFDGVEPILAVSATEAYLAVEDHAPEGNSTLLRFDGRTWTPVLHMPTPVAALRRSPDGAIWVVDGAGVIHHQPPPPAAAGFHALPRRSVTRVVGTEREVHAFDVMPLGSNEASVLATWDGRIGLFTVVAPIPPSR